MAPIMSVQGSILVGKWDLGGGSSHDGLELSLSLSGPRVSDYSTGFRWAFNAMQ
jgi:hypothetical protein